MYDPQSPVIQLLVAAAMIGALVMAVALPEAFGARVLGSAGAYVAIHIVRGLVLVPALRGHEAQRVIRVVMGGPHEFQGLGSAVGCPQR